MRQGTGSLGQGRVCGCGCGCGCTAAATAVRYPASTTRCPTLPLSLRPRAEAAPAIGHLAIGLRELVHDFETRSQVKAIALAQMHGMPRRQHGWAATAVALIACAMLGAAWRARER